MGIFLYQGYANFIFMTHRQGEQGNHHDPLPVVLVFWREYPSLHTNGKVLNFYEGVFFFKRKLMTPSFGHDGQGRTQGGVGANPPLELDILRKLYCKASV